MFIRSKNKIAVLDTRDNLTKQISLNEYNSCNYYIAIASEKIAAIDTRDNNIKQISVEDYNKYDYYKTVEDNETIDLTEWFVENGNVDIHSNCLIIYSIDSKLRISLNDSKYISIIPICSFLLFY